MIALIVLPPLLLLLAWLAEDYLQGVANDCDHDWPSKWGNKSINVYDFP